MYALRELLKQKFTLIVILTVAGNEDGLQLDVGLTKRINWSYIVLSDIIQSILF